MVINVVSVLLLVSVIHD